MRGCRGLFIAVRVGFSEMLGAHFIMVLEKINLHLKPQIVPKLHSVGLGTLKCKQTTHLFSKVQEVNLLVTFDPLSQLPVESKVSVP